MTASAQPRRFPPALPAIVTPFIESRLIAAVFAGAGVLQIAMTATRVGGMRCPVNDLFSTPCPGCGLSRACLALLAGDWGRAMHLNATAPLFLSVLAIFIMAAVLPAGPRARFVLGVAWFERRTNLPFLLLSGVLLYWFVRLMYARL